MLTADWDRWTSGAAADSEPASTTATKARSQSSCRSAADMSARSGDGFDNRIVAYRSIRFTGWTPHPNIVAMDPSVASERRGTWLMVAGGTLLGTLGVFVEEADQSPLTPVFFRCAFGALALLGYGAASGRG